MSGQERIFEYFVVAGLPESLEELNLGANERANKNTASLPPITDICVIFPKSGEQIPKDFVCVETTPTGHQADLNHGSIFTEPCFLGYRRDTDKPPLLDIGVWYEGQNERVVADSETLKTTPYSRSANVNNTRSGIYLCYQRASDNVHSLSLVVTDICVILTNKGETPPHTFRKINKNLNKGIVGSDVFICYKKSTVECNRIAYRPAILHRFPSVDNHECPLPPNSPAFCLPMGALLERWPAEWKAPGYQFSTFVLNENKNDRLYGAAATFYNTYRRPLTPEQLEKLDATNQDSKDLTSMTFHSNKCIAVLSRYPFIANFRCVLLYLLSNARTYISNNVNEEWLSISSMEKWLSEFLRKVSFSASLLPESFLIKIGQNKVCFENPKFSRLPPSGASFINFLQLLGSDHCAYLMLLALTEQKILIHSYRPYYLTSVAEALCSLLFPFRWQYPYVPQCPFEAAGIIHAPSPFIVGVDSRYFDNFKEPPDDVTCFDLDADTVSQSDIRSKIKLDLLPFDLAYDLRLALDFFKTEIARTQFQMKKEKAADQKDIASADVKWQNEERRCNLKIQNAFLRFMALILKGYQQYLKPIQPAATPIGTANLEALFDVNGFLRSRDKSALNFFKLLTKTQMFIRFIEERSLLSDKNKNPYLTFFDEYMSVAK